MRTALVFVLAVAALTGAASADIIDPEIVGGDEAYPHQFPWQAGVWIHVMKDGKAAAAFCGGSLVAEQWVVTAAHCADPGLEVTKFTVVLGAHEINNKTEASQVTIDVDKVFVNPVWKGIMSGSLAGDIALFKLKSKAPINEAIQIIRLPREEQKKDSFWRKTVTISGWGQEHTGDKAIAPVLRYTSNKIVSDFYCKFRFFFLLAGDGNICMSGWGWKGACHGDSGGPMVIYEDDAPTLIGVTSFGFGLACNWGWPSAYTRVTTYLDWVHDTINNN